jgi:predicted CoA-binding protein
MKDKKIAVAGVSLNPEKYGHKIFIDLLAAGYNVYPIGKSGGILGGISVLKTLFDLEEKPDLVIVVTPPQESEKIVKDCIELGIKNIHFQPGAQSQKALEEAQKAGIAAVSGACFMVEKKIW